MNMTEEVKQEIKTEEKVVPPADPAYVITQEELDKLVGTVKAKAPEKTVDEKAIYEKAVAEVRAEFERTQRSKVEEATRKAEAERIAKLEAELTALKEQTAGVHVRKGVANTTNPFQKTEDGKTGIRKDVMEDAIRRYLNPNAR